MERKERGIIINNFARERHGHEIKVREGIDFKTGKDKDGNIIYKGREVLFSPGNTIESKVFYGKKTNGVEVFVPGNVKETLLDVEKTSENSSIGSENDEEKDATDDVPSEAEVTTDQD